MKKSILIIIGIFVIVLLNLFLTYILAWNPFALYFDKPEFSNTHFEIRERNAYFVTVINIILLWVGTIWTIRNYIKKGKFSFIAPVISIATICILIALNQFYPDSLQEYTKEGYQILEERFSTTKGKVFKRWISKDSLKNIKNYKEIVWVLDSTNTK